MDVNEIKYIGSFPKVTDSPSKDVPEYAFIGRSNVGKSSLINSISGRRDIAHVSSKPGKTQMLNFYRVNDLWMICDLPGYGYAKISKKHRNSLENMVRGYLARRQQMQCAFVLIDANIPPQKIDLEFMRWMGANGIPFVIVFTKTDKPKPKKLKENLEAFRSAMLEEWEELPQQFLTSSLDGSGREEILEFIDSVNKTYFNRI